EPDIKPDRLLDNLGREAVAAIADLGHNRWLRLKPMNGKRAARDNAADGVEPAIRIGPQEACERASKPDSD
ncbi:MAG: hypothetical protein ABSF11_15765, partial [Methylocella sp.]